jgi:hypothetical protein
MFPRLLGSFCMAAASLPIAIHLRFSVWEVWSVALLAGIGVLLLGTTLHPPEIVKNEPRTRA